MNIILISPDGTSFRRVHEDGRVEVKELNGQWSEPRLPLPCSQSRDSFVDFMVTNLGYTKSCEFEISATPEAELPDVGQDGTAASR